ncbi:MAG: hypothetical protein NT113_04845 [Hyphomicrobiales bacterium]|nr:hypothetical protein [Hyphomicrobiales bacterium]
MGGGFRYHPEAPINARPNLPGEADYDAIREAFLETARGRWFLAEYAKRNRNADTNLLLDAVSRLEAGVAAQKQQAQGLSLAAALAAIRAAVRQAKATAIDVLPRPEADNGVQAAARNGARIIREIAMTMRECGADSRICSLLDTQVQAIEAGHTALQAQTPESSREAVLASYDALIERIEALADGVPHSAAKADAPAAEQAPEPHEASVTPLFRVAASEVSPVAATPAPTEPPLAPPPRPTFTPAPANPVQEAAAALVTAPASTDASASAEMLADADEAMIDLSGGSADDADDLAVLDAVAMEMGALDADELFASPPETIASVPAEPAPRQPAHPSPTAQAHAEDDMTLAAIAAAALAPVPPQTAQARAPSLGAALIANGVIANPKAPASDPLAPIRRMTQAEKIAFFS